MTQINAYINFNGQCREAMRFYQQCLGGELNLQKISESPMAAQMPSEKGGEILHGTLISNAIVIMASDISAALFVKGNNVNLCLQCSSKQELENFFESLSAAGHISTPLHQTFWGATYGEFTDRFGINWILNYSKN
ncbi:MAG: VOC family protein [Rhizobacter sp.]|nr:VOC family protein [Ferruginibacter sp.]